MNIFHTIQTYKERFDRRYDIPGSWYLIGGISALLVAIALVAYLALIRPPLAFPAQQIISIEEGQTLAEVSNSLYERDVVQSATFFRVAAILLGDERRLVAGDYYFRRPASVFTVAQRITHGETRFEPRAITIPEGATIYRIAQILDYNLLQFDPATFIKYAHGHEGRLFPETYEFHAVTDERDAVQRMRKAFREKIKPLTDEIQDSPYSLEEIVILASILEKEESDHEDRRRIAGVLMNRLERDMPLQVDAAFSHVNGRNTYELTLKDLQSDAPFNTYTNTGLPPHAIGNPGLSSIKAALRPIESTDLFYLSDRNGNTYYSETFEEHKRKKARYIN